MVSKGPKMNGSAMHSIKPSQQSAITDFMLEIIDASNHGQQCQILIKEGHKIWWKRSSEHSKVRNFPDKQDRRALGTKCAMESHFPTERAVTALVLLKSEKLS